MTRYLRNLFLALKGSLNYKPKPSSVERIVIEADTDQAVENIKLLQGQVQHLNRLLRRAKRLIIQVAKDKASQA